MSNHKNGIFGLNKNTFYMKHMFLSILMDNRVFPEAWKNTALIVLLALVLVASVIAYHKIPITGEPK